MRLTRRSFEALPVPKATLANSSVRTVLLRTGQLEHFGGQILQDGSAVNGCFGTNTHLILRASLQVTMDTTDRELQKRRQSACGLRFCFE